MKNDQIIKSVRHWVETLVVGLNLCPFAKRELVRSRVRFAVSAATTKERLLTDLQAELELIVRSSEVETTLLIHPYVLQDFFDYNQFLNFADALLVQMELESIYQVASFHPDYQFGGTEPQDAENYTNKSPYPMLHLICEDSLEQAIANHPHSDQIPDNNIKLLETLGQEKMQALLQACYDAAD